MRKFWIFWGMVLILAACGGGGETAVPAKAQQISCTAAYRSSVQVGIEREETLTFTDADAEQSVAFADLIFHAAYHTGAADNERNLRVWVTDSNDDLLHATLYQLETSSGPQNQFVGGHGFTGLTYSYHPTSGAEMQFWCEAGL
ncbi:MAG: hypothetical protein H6656_08125 [Ardenticatenaceae bacterium]|nr:hypothetical protein [Ardenticatenaceae bacterium]